MLNAELNLKADTGIGQRLFDFGAYLSALFVVSIYFSTAAAIILSALVGLLFLLLPNFRSLLPACLKESPVAASAVLLYLWFFIGLCYGNATSEEAFSVVRKYRELLFIPLFMCLFSAEQYRTWAWRAFFWASMVTLLCSYFMDFGWMAADMAHTFSYSIKSRITHSILMAFFGFYCAHKALVKQTLMNWYTLLFLLAVHNLYLVVEGRTGQLVFLSLILLFALQRFNKKGIIVMLIALPVALALYLNYSEKSLRLSEGLVGTQAFLRQQVSSNNNVAYVIDPRQTYWLNTMKLIAEKPVFGHGTGSFAKAYARVSGDKTGLQNPHNEFLLMAEQFGVVGLSVYLWFLVCLYRDAKQLALEEKWLAHGLLLTLIVSSIFNSPILDHTEGHWFAVLIALLYAKTRQSGSLQG